MAEYKIIEGYDIERQVMEGHEGDYETSEYMGVTVGGDQYVIAEDDWSHAAEDASGLYIPTGAYKVISHNQRRNTTRLQRVSDSSLVRKIALEFRMKGLEGESDEE